MRLLRDRGGNSGSRGGRAAGRGRGLLAWAMNQMHDMHDSNSG